MIESWQTLSEETLDSNPWWSHILRRFRTPDGIEGEYHSTQHPNCVTIFAQDDDGLFVMVREYRYLFDRISVSQAMGGIEPGESPEEAAMRELREETGYEAATLVRIGTIATAPSFSEEQAYVYLATDLKKTGEHDHEIVEVVMMSAFEIDDAIRDGRIWDSNAIAGWYLAKLHLGL